MWEIQSIVIWKNSNKSTKLVSSAAIWRDKEVCHQQTDWLYWCLNLMHLRVHWPQSYSLVFCLFSVVGTIVQSYPVFSVSKSICLSECVRVSWCFSVSCSKFACLLHPPDGMGSVSLGIKQANQTIQMDPKQNKTKFVLGNDQNLPLFFYLQHIHLTLY